MKTVIKNSDTEKKMTNTFVGELNNVMNNKVINKLKLDSNKRFLAQGSEHGFGPFFAWGINNKTLNPKNNKYLIASCNTHNIASIVKSF